MILLTGNSNPKFAKSVAKNLGVELCEVNVSKFSNGETRVDGIVESLRGETVYIIHSPGDNVNDELMEIFILANAAKYATADKIVLVSTCYPYARQDKKLASREPITARLLADLYSAAGISSVITMELHNPAIQGFHSCPTDNLSTLPIFTAYIKQILMKDNPDNFVVVSPDAGGAKRAATLARRLGTGAAIIHKERKKANEIAQMRLLGDVEGQHAIMIDDMSDTCGTLKRAAALIKENGAKTVMAFVTHGVLSGRALENISSSDLDTVYVTDSLNLYDKPELCPKIKVITVTNLIADAITRHQSNTSMGPMFDSLYGKKIISINYGDCDDIREISDL